MSSSCLPSRKCSAKSPSAVRGGVAAVECLPEEILLLISEFSCDSGVDVLSFSLSSCRFADAARLLLRSFLSADFSTQSDSRDGFFRSLPCCRFSEPPRYRSPDLRADSLFYFCRGCLSPVARQRDLDSDQYHGSLGPAFLARETLNTEIAASHADYPVQYTTGHYRVGDVRCVGCARVLGRKYLWAEDVANFYKIGKVLMEQTLVEMPLCCSASVAGAALLPSSSGVAGTPGTGNCSRCTWWQRRGVAASILESTDELSPGLSSRRQTQWLYRAFVTGRESARGASDAGGGGGGCSLRRRLASLLWGGDERWRQEMESLSVRLALLRGVEEDEWRRTLKYVETSVKPFMDQTLMLQALVVNYFKLTGKSNVKSLFYRLESKEERTAVLSALAEVASSQHNDQAKCILHQLKKDIFVPSDSLANWLVCGRPSTATAPAPTATAPSHRLL